MIRDTSAQDRPLDTQPARKRRLLVIGGCVGAALLLAVLGAPALQRAVSTGSSVSAARLSFATVERGPFVRDIAAEGKVVAAGSPTLYAPASGAVTLQVHAGDSVKKNQVLALIDSPDLTAKLAQERSNADAMQADAMRAEVDSRSQRAAQQSTWDNASIDHKTAENDLARQQKAFEAGAVAGMQVDHAKDTLEKARIALANATAGLKLKEDSLHFEC
jgi:HlyD family secretion protein